MTFTHLDTFRSVSPSINLLIWLSTSVTFAVTFYEKRKSVILSKLLDFRTSKYVSAIRSFLVAGSIRFLEVEGCKSRSSIDWQIDPFQNLIHACFKASTFVVIEKIIWLALFYVGKLNVGTRPEIGCAYFVLLPQQK